MGKRCSCSWGDSLSTRPTTTSAFVSEPMPQSRVVQQRRAPAPLPKHPSDGLTRKPLIPQKVKRFDSADYFLTKHLEKQKEQERQRSLASSPTLHNTPLRIDEDQTSSRPSSTGSDAFDLLAAHEYAHESSVMAKTRDAAAERRLTSREA